MSDPDQSRTGAADASYEYIVVGSGAGGGPLAANLAAAGHRVLLLEAGGAPEGFDYQVPAFHPAASEDPEMAWNLFVRHYAEDSEQRRDSKYCAEGNGILYPRAATLGGCTAHNAMILLAPHNSDWEEIARITGDPSWQPLPMRRYFQRLERCHYRPVQWVVQRLLGWSPSRHGFDGWLDVDKADPRMVIEDKPMLRVIVKAAKTALFANDNPLMQIWHSLRGALDPNDWGLLRGNRVGLRLTPLSVANGRRRGSRERILAARRAWPDRLHILTGALATRVLLDEDNRAVGVEYLDGAHLYRADPNAREPNGVPRKTVHASREVILCGGAFNTPQLLQLSGIGPAALLRRHGIAVRVDLPGVGANLQDRYEVTVVSRMKRPFALLAGATMRAPAPGEIPDPQFRLWELGRGPYTSNGAVISLMRRSAAAQRTKGPPDLVLFGLATDFRGYYPGYSEGVRAARDAFTWAVLKAHTENRAGTVAIRSADPTEPPEIQFRYFGEGSDKTGEDLEGVVEAVQLARHIMARVPGLVAEEMVPGQQVKSLEQIRRWIKDEAWGHHASCTCRIGHPSDPDAVLDSRFRVRGTKGLRVVDASVFPRAPGLFIVSAVYTIAEKASDDILADARDN